MTVPVSMTRLADMGGEITPEEYRERRATLSGRQAAERSG